MISDDFKHEKCAVKAFEDTSMKSLLALGFQLKCILQFCDNCSGQYKSKGPFEYISLSETPVIRSFFGKNHGKRPYAGEAGRVKLAAKENRKCGKCFRVFIKTFWENAWDKKSDIK